jgi:hypothetical protein
MWLKQSHFFHPIFDGLNHSHKNGDDWGMMPMGLF